MSRTVPLLVLLLTAAACSTGRDTLPPRTATEQLLISSAADRAADRVARTLDAQGTVFLDTSYFEGLDAPYAIGTIRDALLRHGARLVRNRADADTIVEVRSGALSIDDEASLLGTPDFDVPIPLAGEVPVPEVPLFKKDTAQGVAKFAATALDAETGTLVASTGPQYGFSHRTDWTVLLLMSWQTDDVPAEDARPEPRPW